MKNFIRFNTDKDNKYYELKNIENALQPDGRTTGILIPLNGRILIKKVKKAKYISFHFWNYRIFTYDAKREISVYSGEDYLGKIFIDQNHKNSYHTLPLKTKVNGPLELSFKSKIISGDTRDPVCIGISWSDAEPVRQTYKSISVITQGFTNSGSSIVWDYLSEFNNFDVERSAEMRFVGRIANLYNEIQSHDIIWNDGALKHFISQMYWFYNREGVHGYECSIVHNDTFILQMNKLFAELICCSDEMKPYLDDPSFRFPLEYSEKFKDFSFVVQENDHFKIFYKTSDEVRSNFSFIVQKYLSVWLNSFIGKEFRVFFNLMVRVPFENAISFLRSDQKIIAVYRDPRNQYIQALHQSRAMNIPIPPNFENVDTFISYFKNQIVPWINCNEKNVLILKFEYVIGNYKNAKRKINAFLGCSEKSHIWKKMYFAPEQSLRNIYTYVNYLDDPDIQKISKELKEYCSSPITPFKYYKFKFLKNFVFSKERKEYLCSKINEIKYLRTKKKEKIANNYFINVFGTSDPSSELIKEAYSEATKNRTDEIEAFNKRFLSFAAVVVAIFVAIYSTANHEIIAILQKIGMLLSSLWFCAICGSKHWQSYWERQVEMLEQKRGFILYGMTANKLKKITKKHLQGIKMPMFFIYAATALISLIGFYFLP